MIWETDYTRRLWTTVVFSGVPLAAVILFYVWALLVLVRTARKLWQAAREAQEAWGRADRAVGARGVE